MLGDAPFSKNGQFPEEAIPLLHQASLVWVVGQFVWALFGKNSPSAFLILTAKTGAEW